MAAADRGLRARLEAAGQSWLAQHLESLPEADGQRLRGQLQQIDFRLVASIRAGEGLAEPARGAIEPMGFVPAADRHADTSAATRGREALARGEVACVILAGGQASRLQFDGPKGNFPIGPRTDRSLFRILVEQVLRAGRDHGAIPPLAITTSSTTDAAIRAFFEEQDCFAYPRDTLRFACQAQLPALDEQGRFLLAEIDRVFTNPDGHGGALKALETHGVLEDWESQGIRAVACCQVDNPLLRVVDADFIGRLFDSGFPLVTKIVAKTRPEEKVGVVARVDGRPAIVEYSDISDEDAARRDEDGGLTYRLGSIAVHVFRLDFLRRALREALPLHVARKQIPCVSLTGEPQRVPGTKYERFLFDLFPAAQDLVVCEVERAREFEPLKNAEGDHSPPVVRDALDAQYRRWHEEAGVAPPEESPLELSPLDVLGPQDLVDSDG
ncbi:MAG: UTP--glucose-1-phosphate uridylyltransferase [Planctomycetota bacterium]